MSTLWILAGALAVLPQEGETKPDAERIDRLVRQLGSDEYETRVKADEELRNIGAPAVPALRKAAEDPDVERSLRARDILREIERREKRSGGAPPATGMRVEYHDLTRGLTFRMKPDGTVELTVPEENPDTGKRESKTYTADNLEQFKEKYPEVAKRYRVDRFLPKVRVEGEMEDGWQGRRRRFRFPFGEEEDPFRDFDRMFEEHRRRMEELFRRHFDFGQEPRQDPGAEPAPVPSLPSSFGVRIGPVDETLRSQLGLEESEGVQVISVEEGRLAERSGIQRHDLLLRLDDAPIRDRWQFRQDLRKALARQEFRLEILRGGKREVVTVRPASK